MFVNHEYTNEELMFPGLGRQDKQGVDFAGMTRQLVDIEMSAHGASVIEIKKTNGICRVIPKSPYACRISARTTEMILSRPAAGYARMKTSADPSGTQVRGVAYREAACRFSPRRNHHTV